MTTKQHEARNRWESAMARLGFSTDEALALRRIEMTLHRWHERECGDGNGCIERDETAGKPYFVSAWGERWGMKSRCRTVIPDRETGARKRLSRIMAGKPGLWAYVQTDPRGGALYVGRTEDLCGLPAEQAYYRGVYCNF